MKAFEILCFGVCALLILLGGVVTVGARNPIRGAMGLLATIVGIAGMYLGLAAEFLAAIQIIVYAGAVVVLFIFVIMLLGPSATSPRDARSAIPRYLGAAVFGATAVAAVALMVRTAKGPTPLPKVPASLGTVEGLGRELFTQGVVPFEISGALLLIAVVGAVAIARGKQPDPTLLPPEERKTGRAVHPPDVARAASEAPASREMGAPRTKEGAL
jgi:NADH-quinone oxidoreductase subunit J